MSDKSFLKRLAYEIIIFLSLMALLMFITRIWAILFLIILGIFIAALVLLFRGPKKVEIIEPAVHPEPPPRPETEKDILRRAFGLIQRRITEDVESLHPSARWQWLTPNAMNRIEQDEPVVIILNGAGGYRRATVSVHGFVFKGLIYETVQTLNKNVNQNNIELDDDADTVLETESDVEESKKSDVKDQETTSYAYLAFEWVDSHLLELNSRSNEAIGQGEKTLLISEHELPIRDSWKDICQQLITGGFADAVTETDGILVSLQQ